MPISLYEQHEIAEKRGKFFVAFAVNSTGLWIFPLAPAAIAGVGAVARGLRSLPFVDNVPVVGSLLATTEQVCFETAAAGINRANLFAESEKDSKESEKDSKESKKGSKGLEWKKYLEKLAKEAEESRQNKEYNYLERVFGKGGFTEGFGKFNKGLNNVFDGTIAVASAVGATPFKAAGGLLNYTSDTITLATHLIDNVAIKNLDDLEEGIDKTLGKIAKLGLSAISIALKFGQAPISGAGQVCDSVGEALLTPAKQFGNDQNNPFIKWKIYKDSSFLDFWSNSKDRLEATFKKSDDSKVISDEGLNILYSNEIDAGKTEMSELKNESHRFNGKWYSSPLVWAANNILPDGYKFDTITKEDLESSEKKQLRAINSEAEKISELSKERTNALEELQKALTSEIEKKLTVTSTLEQESIKTALIETLNPTVAGAATGAGAGAATVAEKEIAEAAINSLNPKALKALKNLAELDGGKEKIKELVEPANQAAEKSNNEKSEEAKTEKMKDLAAPAIKKLAKELGKKPAAPAPTPKKEPPTAFGMKFAKPDKEGSERGA